MKFKVPKYIALLIKNIIAAILSLAFILFIVFKYNDGYNWVYNNLPKNFRIIMKHKNLEDSEKLRAKLGHSYSYLEFIKSMTPENAVILFPSKDALFPKDKKSEMKKDMYNKLWILRFLYPRKIVMVEEIGQIPLSEQITHIAIANGKGYEYLDYTPPMKPDMFVFPVISPFN